MKKRIGSTGKGVGAAISAKSLRDPDFRLARDIPELEDYLGDVALYANRFLDEDKTVTKNVRRVGRFDMDLVKRVDLVI